MAKAPTVYDVADKAGVSIATVSRVLRSPDAVREVTAARVMDAVRELGYLPSGSARGLAARRTNVIGLFLPGHDSIREPIVMPTTPADEIRIIVDSVQTTPDTGEQYFDEVLRGAEIEAWHNGFALMIAVGRGSSREALVNDIASRVDGLAVLSSTVPDESLAHVARRIPVVLMAGPRRGDDLDHVGVNNVGGMRALTKIVLAQPGIHDVVFVAGPADSPDSAERTQGFHEAVAEVGLDVARVRILDGDFSREGGRRAARLALDDGTPPSAIVCANDQTAIGVLEVLEKRGIDVPETTVVTGFDGIAAGRATSPSLTTVHQPMVNLGRVAVQAIIARLADADLPPQTLTLPVEVVLRDSCPLPAGFPGTE